MSLSIFICTACLLVFKSCAQVPSDVLSGVTMVINDTGSTVLTRLNPPTGFTRTHTPPSSFGHFLRALPLKPHDAPVLLYNGERKGNQDAHAAVLKVDVGKRDLQQCADAVIRLRGEYLYKAGQFNKIHFNFTSGFRADYSKWMQGFRIKVSGNKAEWVLKRSPSNSYADFREYMDIIFQYAGTLSLSGELQPVSLADMQIGDVFIRGGSPGHAVLVIDVAENIVSKEKVFLLAQSYMPAQEIHILKDPNGTDGNPWYSAQFSGELVTPEWTFFMDEHMRFKER